MGHENITITELDQMMPDILASASISKEKLGYDRPQNMILLSGIGQGKTSWCETSLKEHIANWKGISPDRVGVLIEKPARRDCQEMAGVAIPQKGEDDSGYRQIFMEYCISPILMEIRRMLESGDFDFVILLVDEITAAADPEQKVFADVFDNREHSIGGLQLPDECYIVGTGNRVQDRAGSGNLLSQLADRSLVYNVTFCPKAFDKFAESHNINPCMREAAQGLIPEGLMVETPPSTIGKFCTPRGFINASIHLDQFMASDAFDGRTIDRIAYLKMAGCIGGDAARQVIEFIELAGELPEAAQILSDPENADVPDQTAYQMLATNQAIAAMESVQDAENVLTYAMRLRPDLQVSLGVKILRVATRNGWIVTSPLAVEFTTKFHDLLPLAVSEK